MVKRGSFAWTVTVIGGPTTPRHCEALAAPGGRGTVSRHASGRDLRAARTRDYPSSRQDLRKGEMHMGIIMNWAGPPMYQPPYKAPVFNHDLSYWYRAYGVQLHDVPRAKIVIFGIPKSGNVWLQSLLCDALALRAIDPVAQTDVSGVGMTHLPFCAAVADREDFVHGVCLVRDPRDVLASFYRYSKTPYFRTARLEFHYEDWNEFYYDWYLSRALPAFDLLAHSDVYARLGVPVLRYERLRVDPVREVTRLLKRWGLPADEQAVANAVKENEISRLRMSGKRLNVEVPPSHFGSGRIGTFKSEIPPEILLDFENRFSSLLSRWGYRPTAMVRSARVSGVSQPNYDNQNQTSPNGVRVTASM